MHIGEVIRRMVTDSTPVNTDEDRYPTLTRLLQRIISETPAGDDLVERLEVNAFASGEGTYRYWAPRAEEPEGGYLAPE
jgi:hypothetical protein